MLIHFLVLKMGRQGDRTGNQTVNIFLRTSVVDKEMLRPVDNIPGQNQCLPFDSVLVEC